MNYLDTGRHELVEGGEGDGEPLGVCAAALVGVAVVVAHAREKAHIVAARHQLAAAPLNHAGIHTRQHLLAHVIDAHQI